LAADSEAVAEASAGAQTEEIVIVLLDTSDDLEACRHELGTDVGQLLTPLTRFKDRGLRYGIDNGAFSGFDADGFRALLKRQLPHKDRCLFVTVPDVVASARRTLEVFDWWAPQIAAHGWPIALVIQDGIEDLPMPWTRIDAVFIGGSTAFKLSAPAEHVIRAAQILGKWTHVGRVNSPERFDKFLALGVDSIDGTGISRYSHMRKALTAQQRGLLADVEGIA
jgi:hypothetical protein